MDDIAVLNAIQATRNDWDQGRFQAAMAINEGIAVGQLIQLDPKVQPSAQQDRFSEAIAELRRTPNKLSSLFNEAVGREPLYVGDLIPGRTMHELRDDVRKNLFTIRKSRVARRCDFLMQITAAATRYPYWLWYAVPVGNKYCEHDFIGGEGHPEDDLRWLALRIKLIDRTEWKRRIVEPFLRWQSDFLGMLNDLERMIGGSESLPPRNGFWGTTNRFFWNGAEQDWLNDQFKRAPDRAAIVRKLLSARLATVEDLAGAIGKEGMSDEAIHAAVSRVRKQIFERLDPIASVPFENGGYRIQSVVLTGL